MISVQAGAIWGSCIGPYDARKRGDFLLNLSVATIYSKLTLIEFVFFLYTYRPDWRSSGFLCGKIVSITISFLESSFLFSFWRGFFFLFSCAGKDNREIRFPMW